MLSDRTQHLEGHSLAAGKSHKVPAECLSHGLTQKHDSVI